MKVALLGAGEPHFEAHLRTLQVLPEVTSIIVWGHNLASLESIQASQPDKVTEFVTDLAVLLQQAAIAFAIVTVPNDQKPEICTQLLAAGIHLMVEKPIANTAAEVTKIVEQAEQLNLALGTCYQNRYMPPILKARDLISEGIIGPLMSIEMRILTTQPRFRNPNHWLFDQAQAGGGILAWLGCHYLDLLGFISGDEIVSVSAEVATGSGAQIDVEDIAVVSFRMRSGALGSLHAGYTLTLESNIPSVIAPKYDTYIAFNGCEGRIFWSMDDRPIELHVETVHPEWASSPKQTYRFTIADSPAYGGVSGEAFVRDFIRATQGQGQPPASGRDALQVARLIDAAYKSSREGRRIKIDLPST